MREHAPRHIRSSAAAEVQNGAPQDSPKPSALHELAPSGPLGAETRLALLLPLTGPYANQAEMVREGFMAALYAAAPHPSVRVYDTGSGFDGVRRAVEQARSDGAQFLIGPLRKDAVMALAAQGTPSVPVLALNYLDSTQFAPSYFYQLGLAPEDEARAAAEQAAAAGLRHAAALTPQNEWGERILAAFSHRLTELGGDLISIQRYSPDSPAAAQPIAALMGLPESEERHRALMAVLGTKTEFDARRRDDLDFVFVAARAEQGRLLVPQLRFHRLGNLPVYATSQAFDSGAGDSDLSGLRTCDMPLMLDNNGRYAALRAQLSELFPRRSRDQQRLFALGYDAFQLLGFLRSGPLPAGGGFPAATGDLGMGGNGAITRALSCADLRVASAQP